jgi:hypothetical protein
VTRRFVGLDLVENAEIDRLVDPGDRHGHVRAADFELQRFADARRTGR